VELESGLIIFGCMVHQKDRSRWVGMPSKLVLDADGTQIVDDRGKRRFQRVIGARNAAVMKRFGDRIIALIRVAHPGTFPEAGVE
jgi:hypothetical protein